MNEKIWIETSYLFHLIHDGTKKALGKFLGCEMFLVEKSLYSATGTRVDRQPAKQIDPDTRICSDERNLGCKPAPLLREFLKYPRNVY